VAWGGTWRVYHNVNPRDSSKPKGRGERASVSQLLQEKKETFGKVRGAGTKEKCKEGKKERRA